MVPPPQLRVGGLQTHRGQKRPLGSRLYLRACWRDQRDPAPLTGLTSVPRDGDRKGNAVDELDPVVDPDPVFHGVEHHRARVGFLVIFGVPGLRYLSGPKVEDQSSCTGRCRRRPLRWSCCICTAQTTNLRVFRSCTRKLWPGSCELVVPRAEVDVLGQDVLPVVPIHLSQAYVDRSKTKQEELPQLRPRFDLATQ